MGQDRSFVRRKLLLALDLVLIAAATLIALAIRENFEVSEQKLRDLGPYLALTIAVAAPTLAVLRLDRAIWRFSAAPDFLRIVAAAALMATGAMVLGFSLNRLEGVARSLPVLQALLIAVLLIGIRVLIRIASTRSRFAERPDVGAERPETVLVVGLTRLAELYLRAAAEAPNSRIRIAGLLALAADDTGRMLQQARVLGTPEDLPRLLPNLEVHGVRVDRIVVTVARSALSESANAKLEAARAAFGIHIDSLHERLGFAGDGVGVEHPGRPAGGLGEPSLFALQTTRDLDPRRAAYWRMKRCLDVLAAATLLVLLTPVGLVAAALAARDVGTPITFWQERPGAHGRPFRLYKLRTMRAAHDASGIPDEHRVSALGMFLRRSRLDELPQLVNILRGDMSFVGPRPLLPADQPRELRARLAVRPGLTGWAQVEGGRSISPADKAALDVWYVENASFALDVSILLRAARLLVSGERVNPAAIRRAWAELRRRGICTAGAPTATGKVA